MMFACERGFEDVSGILEYFADASFHAFGLGRVQGY